jgi:23S rRNA (adenine2503-C2)-methyltransferase
MLDKKESNDGTIKYYFTNGEKDFQIESCLLNLKKYEPNGNIVCISSQLGCSQNCAFCAAGIREFRRNLTKTEILEQVLLIIKDLPMRFINPFQITYMGAGEPFCNIRNVLESAHYLIDNFDNISKINISTTLPTTSINIENFNFLKNRLHLQYSLHFVNENLRIKYLNVNLPTIEESLNYLDILSNYVNDKYSINYLLFDNINDSENDAKQLVNILKNRNVFLKISEPCEITSSIFKPSTKLNNFIDIIKLSNIQYEIFISDGQDVNAGCGQFYNDSII